MYMVWALCIRAHTHLHAHARALWVGLLSHMSALVCRQSGEVTANLVNHAHKSGLDHGELMK